MVMRLVLVATGRDIGLVGKVFSSINWTPSVNDIIASIFAFSVLHVYSVIYCGEHHLKMQTYWIELGTCFIVYHVTSRGECPVSVFPWKVKCKIVVDYWISIMFLFGFFLKQKGFMYLSYFTLMVDYVAKWKLHGISYMAVLGRVDENKNGRVEIDEKWSND